MGKSNDISHIEVINPSPTTGQNIVKSLGCPLKGSCQRLYNRRRVLIFIRFVLICIVVIIPTVFFINRNSQNHTTKPSVIETATDRTTVTTTMVTVTEISTITNTEESTITTDEIASTKEITVDTTRAATTEEPTTGTTGVATTKEITVDEAETAITEGTTIDAARVASTGEPTTDAAGIVTTKEITIDAARAATTGEPTIGVAWIVTTEETTIGAAGVATTGEPAIGATGIVTTKETTVGEAGVTKTEEITVGKAGVTKTEEITVGEAGVVTTKEITTVAAEIVTTEETTVGEAGVATTGEPAIGATGIVTTKETTTVAAEIVTTEETTVGAAGVTKTEEITVGEAGVVTTKEITIDAARAATTGEPTIGAAWIVTTKETTIGAAAIVTTGEITVTNIGTTTTGETTITATEVDAVRETTTVVTEITTLAVVEVNGIPTIAATIKTAAEATTSAVVEADASIIDVTEAVKFTVTSTAATKKTTITATEAATIETTRNEIISYEIIVVTGDVPRAGTNSNVFLIIYGENQGSDTHQLSNSKTNEDPFEQNKTDIFDIKSVSLGKLKKIEIWHHGAWIAPNWFLDRIVIRDLKTNQTYSFKHNDWVEAGNNHIIISVENTKNQHEEHSTVVHANISKLLFDYSLEIKNTTNSEDLFICGKCHTNFTDLNIFLTHRSICVNQQTTDICPITSCPLKALLSADLETFVEDISSNLLPTSDSLYEPNPSRTEFNLLSSTSTEQVITSNETIDTIISDSTSCSSIENGMSGMNIRQCPVCDKQFESQTILERHVFEHSTWIRKDEHINSKIDLPAAANATSSSDNNVIDESFEVYGLNQVFRCLNETCSQLFEKPIDYILHAQIHSQKHSTDSQCSSQNNTDHCNHRRRYRHLRRIYRCKICKKLFQTSDQLQYHMQHEIHKFFCQLCPAEFESSNSYHNHLAKHSDLALYHCTICTKAFLKRADLSRHVITEHNQDISKGKTCSICELTFKTCFHLNRHNATKHSDIKPFKCKKDGCEEAFARKDKLKQHEAKHNISGGAYKCDLCSKTFIRPEHLRDHHIAKHSHQYPFSCEYCQKGFIYQSQLYDHYKQYHLYIIQTKTKKSSDDQAQQNI